ncbi:MAG: type II toxin-antitoxin system RnlB family antitoxin [Proteobacteria bacterium]|nr:type II toxin-antitoxin system RnlB family antitoxin [Pseudomonadota bacterium]
MNNKYLIQTKLSESFSAAVFAVGAVSPMEYLSQVEKDLKRKKVHGAVLFDLLLAHGSKSNRFFVGEFNGEHFSSPQFKNRDDCYSDFSVFSARIFKENAEKVNDSLLSKAMRFALKRGIPL